MTTSDRLKQIMQERNLKQIDILKLAEPYCKEYSLTLSKSDLSQFVSGKVKPGQWKLTLLGKALNVSEAWLMGLDVPRERNHVHEVDAKSELTASEIELLQCFRACNSTGQQMILANARVYAGNPDMQKSITKSSKTAG